MASFTHRFLLFFSCLVCFTNSFPVLGSRSSFALFPVAKDAATLQYVARISHGTPLRSSDLVVDLGGSFLWVDCDSGHVSSSRRLISSCSVNCSRAKSHDLGKKTCLLNTNCYVFPDNGVTGLASTGELVEDAIAVDTVDFVKVGKTTTVDHFFFSCAPAFHLQGLASAANGMVGLGKASVSLPSQLSSSIGHPQRFSLCLSPLNGVVLTGNGDAVFGTKTARSLVYTPLTIKQNDYFIHVKSIKIGGRRLSFHGEGKYLEAKLSTTVAYTKMESPFFATFSKAYAEAAARMNMTRVAAVDPFGLCFSSKGAVGNKMPEIELVLQSEMVKWRIEGENLMVKVNKERICVGVLDGGYEQSSPILIGGLQMEDNLLEFDIGSSMLGFSSSLLFKGTPCSSFLQDSKLKQFI
ncbi:putative Eukaryotic aspartyl protease family protein [Hibiscus syriacus]|uniref:Eukaryotic aspartyl protease family protein n=1 Tax=Hibiscus syriacus TaxID=106335 RepID=A0A6A2ZJZ5_HIBSY|nr:probable aspartic proteinase GIP2 [Hibiscus syriacus]KAE8692364.1 putative Eukaryotic aspartyl protease family protein [Hibiscus syriacus]